jgi:hypothetical protein
MNFDKKYNDREANMTVYECVTVSGFSLSKLFQFEELKLLNIALITRMRIAIIGSGIAGLTACWLLSRDHEVNIFEAADTLGMDADSCDIPNNETLRIDMPLRV